MIICSIYELREENDCHNPAGPGGGQFCSGSGGTSYSHGAEGYQVGYPVAQASAMQSARAAMMRASFEEGAPRETMSVVDSRGVFVGKMVTGSRTEIIIPKDAQRAWIDAGPVVTAHTHPNSGTFSIDDLILHNRVNREGHQRYPLQPRVPLAVEAMHVFGEDGSWYEMRFNRTYTDDEEHEMSEAFGDAVEAATTAARVATTRWANAQGLKGRTSMEVFIEAKRAGKEAAIEAYHRRAFRDRVADFWTAQAEKYGFEYRYHLAD